MTTPGAATSLLGQVGMQQHGQQAGSGAGQEHMVAVPAGLIGSLLGSIGNLIPLQATPSGVDPAKTGLRSSGEDLIAVPAGFLGSLLGGIGGGLVGRAVGGRTGGTIGKAAGGTLGALLPFQVIPSGVDPASAGPQGSDLQAQSSGEDLIAVPAGFFGHLAGSIGGGLVGRAIGGRTGGAIGKAAGGALGGLLPFQVIPSGVDPASVDPASVDPASAGPQSGGEDLIAVPAGFFGHLLGSVGGGLVGRAVGGKTGGAIGKAAGGALGRLLPFQVIPAEADA